MKLARTKRGDLGLAAMILLARGESSLLTASEIAAAINGTVPLMHEILRALSRSGLITGQPSHGGGYRLARPAGEISTLKIVEVLEGPIANGECPLWGHQCRWEAACPRLVSDLEPSRVCPLHAVWQPIREATARALAELSLAELAGQDEQARLESA